MKFLYTFILMLCALCSNAQNITSSRWSDLFSYNNVLQIRQKNDGTLIAATQNGIFFYNPASGEVSKLSKANGLHEVKISAFDYNSETGIGLVGYTSGNMDVISEDGIQYVVDIPLSSGFTGNKKINHIFIKGDKAVISANYGISIFNLDKKEFGDTTFFLEGSVYTAANEAVIFGDKVYAATAKGIKSHAIENSLFSIYSYWETDQAGNFTQISTDGNLMVGATSSQLYKNTGSGFSSVSGSFVIKDVAVVEGQILVTENKKVSLLTDTGSVGRFYQSEEVLNTAWYISSGIFSGIFSGSQASGILNESSQSFKPDGPYDNRSYKIALDTKGRLWVSTGARDSDYNNALIDSRNLGFYFYNGKEWIYPSYFKNNSTISFNIIDAIANPSNYKEVFLANYVYSSKSSDVGFYKFTYNEVSRDFEFNKSYYTSQRAIGLIFDDNNNLFGVTGKTSNANLYSETTSLCYFDRNNDKFIEKDLQIDTQNAIAAQKPLYYEGIIWIPIPRKNIFAAVDLNNTPANLNDDKVYTLTSAKGLPESAGRTISVSIDKSGDAWIGSDKGLRVLYNAATEIKADSPQAEPVVIEENGVGEELFRDASVLQITVDSGNQKWVSVNGGGVFYLNSTGETTIHKFTAENSPLPTNSVTDIKIDESTGKVYFVTLDGIVTYQGDVTDVTENFGDVLVYPNPVVYANYKGNVRIKGLAEKTNIRITDAAGNLVHQAVARGGYYEWDLKNQRGARVASGIYFVLMTNEDGTDTATAKIAVVN
ncbi:T9SS type A sorting domain-containing protein [Daejeonia sp. YH14]|uniref:type IX secretion system anionic LPS delivery protein PorZ n=1 Tax=Daejeonia sp. YH14 TaxID=3439042 RepID=UPI003F4912F8